MYRQNSKYVRWIAVWIAAVIFFTGSAVPLYAAEPAEIDLEGYQEILDAYGNRYKFDDYVLEHQSAARPEAEYLLNAADYTRAEGMDPVPYEDYEGVAGVSIWTDEEGLIEWTVDIAESGLYNMSLLYYSFPGKSSDIQRSVFIDGELPFSEASSVEFRRTWVNALDHIQVDNRGNDLRPSQIEQNVWRESLIEDAMASYTEPFSFYFSAGTHTVTLVSQREPMLLRSVKIFQTPPVPSYAELSSHYGSINRPANQYIPVQGEGAVRKSSPMLYPSNDGSSPAVTPYSPSEIKINNIGDGTWETAGQWIEWDFEVPEDGLYRISMNVKQNFVRGTNVYRKVSIDGVVPFKEMEAVPFAFKDTWRVETLGGEADPYLFYLTKGTHTLRMEVVLGEYAQYVREITESVYNLNSLYRQIVMITGIAPDTFRDYQIARRLPNLESELYAEREKMDRIYDELITLSGGKGERDTVIRTLSTLLKRLYGDVETVTKRIGMLKTNIGSLGTWLMEVREMSLAVDCIYITSPDMPVPKVDNGWLAKFKHEITTLYYSFIIDYNAIGNVSDDQDARTVTVWVGTGRDQANTIKALVDENFTVNTNINVNLMLVQMDTLLPATLSGQGPDVAMMVGNDLPMNYGMRGAVANLAEFSDFNMVRERFLPSAMVPYEFRDRCFALPETQSFNMLFYRKDVLTELGLDLPETWDDLKAALSVLSKNYMSFGLPVSYAAGQQQLNMVDNTFAMLLYQAGGSFYTEDGVTSALDSDISISTFREMTKYFTDYKLPNPYDFVNRFRTGEMPIAIADYTNYNTLQVFAPEIKGLWGFTTVPGTRQANGEVDHSVATGGSAVVLMDRSKDKAAAWEFLKWWTSAETQTRYGRAMEALMGSAARYPTANQEAFAMLPWPVEDYKSLMEQFAYAKGIPQVPGGYFTSRQINNAFYKVVTEKKIGPREALTDYTRYINDEIKYKRKEFGVD